MARRTKQLAQTELYRELVPLGEAAAVAYHVVTDRPLPLKDPRMLDEVRSRVAIALASLAPVLRRDRELLRRMSAKEVDERLFAPEGARRIDDLCMRRCDLVRAVESLKQAHIAFGAGAPSGRTHG